MTSTTTSRSALAVTSIAITGLALTGCAGKSAGTRADLPIPVSLAIYGGGTAVLISFVALGTLWPEARLGRGDHGRRLPAVVQSVVDSSITTVVVRLLALVVAAVVLVAAFIGSK